MTTAGALLTALWLAAGPAAATRCADELFRIERSLNANVIVYEVVRRPDGDVDPDRPVRASWIMLARRGEREDLNLLERVLAYGFEVRPAEHGRSWWLTLKAEKGRPLRVADVDGCPAALGAIGGREGALRRIYVKADDQRLIPRVEYVDVFGVELRTGAPLHERIVPAPEQEPDRPEWRGG